MATDKIEQVCETCKYFSGGSYSGDCRKYPPKHHEAGFFGTSGTKWPEVKARNSCGEWKKGRVAKQEDGSGVEKSWDSSSIGLVMAVGLSLIALYIALRIVGVLN